MTSNLSLSHLQTESDFAANFWPSVQPRKRNAAISQITPPAAANLCELFVYDLSLLVAGACQTDRLARSYFAALAPDQLRLRRLVLGLVQTARGCVPALPPVLEEEGLVLPLTHDLVVDVLLRPIDRNRRAALITEPSSVADARTVAVFTHVALHFETAATYAAGDARLLGSDRLWQALTKWAAMWRDYLRELRLRAMSFRAQAYAAGLNALPDLHRVRHAPLPWT